MEKLETAIGIRLALVLAGLKSRTLSREEGQTFVEYAMIIALIGLAVIAGLTVLKGQINAAYTSVANAV